MVQCMSNLHVTSHALVMWCHSFKMSAMPLAHRCYTAAFASCPLVHRARVMSLAHFMHYSSWSIVHIRTCMIVTALVSIVQSVVLQSHVVRLSVCPSVTLEDSDHIRCKSWKLIALTISPTLSLFVAQRHSTYSHGEILLRLEVGEKTLLSLTLVQ